MVNVAAIMYGIGISVTAMVLGILVSRRDRKLFGLRVTEVNQSDISQEEKDKLIAEAKIVTSKRDAITNVFAIAAFVVGAFTITFVGIAPALMPAGT